MNRLYRYILAATAIVAAASCTENLSPETEPSSDNLVQMTFTTTVDEAPVSKTTYKSRNVYWEAADRITVFSVGDETVPTEFGVKELAADKTSATFEGLADAQATSFYAVYPHNAKNAYADGTLTVYIPSEQTAVADGFASGANVSVAYTENNEEASLQFRNVTTLLCIKFTDEADAENTGSITFKAKKNEMEYWGLSGKASVTLDAETKLPVAGEGDVQYVTLEAPDGGFVKDVVYFIPAYPVGDCTGFEVAFTALDGGTSIKTKNASGTLQRNWLFNFSSIPNPYPVAELQEEFTIEWDFVQGWPFEGECKYESEDGETYNYAYYYNAGKNRTDWNLKMGYKSYEMQSTGLANTGGNSFIMQLPAVDERYLTQLTVLLSSEGEANSRVAIQSRWTNSGAGQYCLMPNYYIKKGGECIIDFYSDQVVFTGDFSNNTTTRTFSTEDYPNFAPEAGKEFYFKLRDAGIISKITLTYSSVKPGNTPTE